MRTVARLLLVLVAVVAAQYGAFWLQDQRGDLHSIPTCQSYQPGARP